MNDALCADLAQILGPGALVAHFQPIAQMVDAKVVGVEALARWRGDDGVVLSADAVWSAAAAIDARAALCGAMAAQAMGTFAAARWSYGLELSVNAGCPDIAEPSFAAAFLGQAALFGIAPNRLWLEITEDAPLDDAAGVIRALGHLRAAGVRVAVDDFGAGFATLSWLLCLPLDGIKLDRAFANGVEVAGPARAVATHTIGLARELGLSFVAEGIETASQRSALMELGCGKGQGRLFGMATEELVRSA
jgi:diguanylate cyclase